MTDIVSVPRTDIVHVEFLDEVKEVVQKIVDTKDFESGFLAVKKLYERSLVFKDAVGMFLDGMNGIWNPDKHEGESFIDAAARVTGLDKVTVRNHLKIHKALPLVPEEYKEEVALLPFRSKMKVAELVEGGYEMDDSDWLNIVQHPAPIDAERITREIKGVEPRSNWFKITMDEHGIIYQHTAEGVEEAGRLHVDNPKVSRTISRLKSGGKIQEY